MFIFDSEKINHVHIEVPMHPPVEGYSYMMTCNVSGPADQVLWLKNGQPLITDARVVMSMDNRTVTLNELHRNDSGQYHCWAINPAQQLPSPPHLLIVNCEYDVVTVGSVGSVIFLHLTTFGNTCMLKCDQNFYQPIGKQQKIRMIGCFCESGRPLLVQMHFLFDRK